MPFSYLLRLAKKLVVKRVTETFFIIIHPTRQKNPTLKQGQKISFSDGVDLPFCFAFIFMLWRQIELN